MTDLDWISFRAAQSFPVADEAPKISNQGILLPNSLILDLHLTVPPEAGADIVNKVYIKQIIENNSTISVILGYQGMDIAGSYNIPKTINMTTAIKDRSFAITPINLTENQLDWLDKLFGSISIGTTEAYSLGSMTFSLQQSKLNPICISFLALQQNCVESLIVGETKLTGDITLQAGQGILLQASDSTVIFKVDPQYIQQKTKQRTIEDIIALYGQPIVSINGVLPDNNGNINFTGMDCVQINPLGQAGFISISNPCAKPCCSSTDTDKLSTDLQILQTEQIQLRNYFINMANTVNYMQSNLSTLMAQK